MPSASRDAQLAALRAAPLDALILGGGINGAGLLRDLTLRAEGARRPLRVGLVERAHFASGTSGRNSQLIHGGLRYLKNLEFRLVREALQERATLLRIAPHLVEPLGFLIPMQSLVDRVTYGIGLRLYDLLAGSRNIAPHRGLSRREVRALEPGLGLEPLAAGALFYDCRVHSARLVLENVLDAVRLGGIAANYTRMVARRRTGEHWSVTLEDTLGGGRFEVTTRAVVDATGAWSDAGTLRLVRGSHVVLPRLGRSEHAVAYFEPAGRIIFFIPWGARRDRTLVGTTDVDHEAGPNDVGISDAEVGYLLEIARRVFPAAAGMAPLAAYSSLRPLLRDESASATKTSREHRIWLDAEGVLRIAGGKYTTYRAMAEEAANLLLPTVAPGWAGGSRTADVEILGNTRDGLAALRAEADAWAARSGLTAEDVRELVTDYGVAMPDVIRRAPDVAPPGLTRLQAARIRHAAAVEFAQKPEDVLHVSTYWGHERRWAPEEITAVAREMAAITPTEARA